MQDVPVWQQPTPEIFEREIAPTGKPALLRGIAADWPLVNWSREGDARCMEALCGMAGDAMIDIVVAPPENEGRIHYSDDLRTLNFERTRAPLADLVRALARESTAEAPRVIAAQSVPVEQVIARFGSSHAMPFAPAGTVPRLWIGNAAKVATHNDPMENIAVVGAGRRRFTLFAPDQIGNLYLGPLHFTPAGTPISMVHLTKPDLDRYPRFADAMACAWVAELEPGDAIYIPYGWYHHVEALRSFNILVNYWWNPAPAHMGSPWDAMLHGIMSLRGLPEQQRQAWRAAFDHYVFLSNGSPGEHLPEFARGILGAETPRDIALMRAELLRNLAPPPPA